MNRNIKIIFIFIILLILLFVSNVFYAYRLKSIVVICNDYPNPSHNNIKSSMNKNLEKVKYLLNKLKSHNIIDIATSIYLLGRNATKNNTLATTQAITDLFRKTSLNPCKYL